MKRYLSQMDRPLAKSRLYLGALVLLASVALSPYQAYGNMTCTNAATQLQQYVDSLPVMRHLYSVQLVGMIHDACGKICGDDLWCQMSCGEKRELGKLFELNMWLAGQLRIVQDNVRQIASSCLGDDLDIDIDEIDELSYAIANITSEVRAEEDERVRARETERTSISIPRTVTIPMQYDLDNHRAIEWTVSISAPRTVTTPAQHDPDNHRAIDMGTRLTQGTGSCLDGLRVIYMDRRPTQGTSKAKALD